MARQLYLVAFLLAAFFSFVGATRYTVTKTYAGKTFFDDWIFYNNFDNLTNGETIYVSAKDASKDNLAFINDAGNAIMRVDNTTQVSVPNKRNSIRITTKDHYTVGSVWVADMLHVPYGCSVWPAFWSQAPNWPVGGEIDTFEGVNMVDRNQMSLHTEPGCVQQNATQLSTMVNTTDCSYLAAGNEGCAVFDPSTSSYGEGFANSGGGVFVTEFAATGISVWFFNRTNVPAAFSSSNSTSFDTSTLGIPTANWPNTGCDINTFFKPQSLIFDIALCGDFAGSPSVFDATCSGICYEDYVLGPPSTFDNAYFEVKSVTVYGNGRITTISAAANLVPAASRILMILGALIGFAVTYLL